MLISAFASEAQVGFDSEKVGLQRTSLTYVADGDHQVNSSRSQQSGSISQKGFKKYEAKQEQVGDVQFNSLLEGNLQYLQYTHNTYEALRQYRQQQLKQQGIQIISAIPQTPPPSPVTPPRPCATYVYSPTRRICGSEDERYDAEGYYKHTYQLNVSYEPGPQQNISQFPSYAEPYQNINDDSDSDFEDDEKVKKGKLNYSNVLQQDLLKELKNTGRSQKVIDWVNSMDIEQCSTYREHVRWGSSEFDDIQSDQLNKLKYSSLNLGSRDVRRRRNKKFQLGKFFGLCFGRQV
eukprot:TRINITY_DN10220_c0_g1_i1.p1 TRINITY_DN10220_c0_g1~~TRINITY_DN10220_c0_g1_i1.p1  ORF type:complete len:292 (-),score=22.81 TRINITY_DN10220_c0_g1_i1:207-1082(-)